MTWRYDLRDVNSRFAYQATLLRIHVVSPLSWHAQVRERRDAYKDVPRAHTYIFHGLEEEGEEATFARSIYGSCTESEEFFFVAQKLTQLL